MRGHFRRPPRARGQQWFLRGHARLKSIHHDLRLNHLQCTLRLSHIQSPRAGGSSLTDLDSLGNPLSLRSTGRRHPENRAG